MHIEHTRGFRILEVHIKFTFFMRSFHNIKVAGLVQVAAFALDEDQSLKNLINLTKLLKDLLIFDNGEFSYINLSMFMEPLLKMWIL